MDEFSFKLKFRSYSTTKVLLGVQSAARPVRADFCVPKKPRHSASRWRKMWYRRWKRMQVFLNFRVPPIKTQRVMRRLKRKIRKSNNWVQNYFGLMLNRFMPQWNLHILVGIHGGKCIEDELIEKFKIFYNLKLRHISSRNLRGAIRKYEPKYWDIVVPFPREKIFSIRGPVFFMWGPGSLFNFLKIAKKELSEPRFVWKSFRTGYSCLWVDDDALEFFFKYLIEHEELELNKLLFQNLMNLYLFPNFTRYKLLFNNY